MSELNRRSFVKTNASAAAIAMVPVPLQAAAARETDRVGNPLWYRDAWRRSVIDMHISDWDPAFFSKFDPKQYADLLEQSRAQSIVCYCQSHVGLFNYPTQVGKQHAGFQGRDVMKEMIDRCHEKNIAVVLYCSLIYDRTAGELHPEWRMRTWEGKLQGEGDRHCVLCVNSPYRDYVRRFVEEICGRFDFEGIRFDMTFWPSLCYCSHCQSRFDREVGGEIPKTVNWLDSKWVAFQRARERWLIEFAKIATDAVRQLKPSATVEHQSSTYPLHWMFGVTEGLTEQNDFLQGDFYGDQLQGSFVRKLLERITPNRPFGYETSFSLNLQDHTAMKSEALLEAKASAAIADSAAFIFIDAIDPIGTVNHRAHERMGTIFDRLMPLYEHLGGERVEDIAIFYSLESKFNMNGNGRHVSNPDTTDTHTQSAMQVASRLIRAHLPFGVITKKSLAALDRFRLLILSNVHMMDREECDAIREWVWAGGRLIATGATSLVDKQGKRQDDFMLADVLGISVTRAEWQDRKHYIAPTDLGQAVLPEFSRTYPAYCHGLGIEVRAASEGEVLAATTLPWPRDNPTRFASIHSDPPWVPTDLPEIFHHRFGKGESIYCASLIESLENAESALVNLIRRFDIPFRIEADAPPCVEMTLFRQPDRSRYVLSLLNFQKELPNIPILGMECRLRLPESINVARHINDNQPIAIRNDGSDIRFTAPTLQTLSLVELSWA